MWQPLRSLQPFPEHINKAPSEKPKPWSNTCSSEPRSLTMIPTVKPRSYSTHKSLRESSVTLEGWPDWARASTALCPPSLCGPWGPQGEAHLTLAS